MTVRLLLASMPSAVNDNGNEEDSVSIGVSIVIMECFEKAWVIDDADSQRVRQCVYDEDGDRDDGDRVE